MFSCLEVWQINIKPLKLRCRCICLVYYSHKITTNKQYLGLTDQSGTAQRSRPVLFAVCKDEVSSPAHEGDLPHHVASLFGIFIFLPSAVSMETRMCLVGEAQRPAECVSTVNIDHNTIYWLRCNGQLTPGGISLWKPAAKHTLHVLTWAHMCAATGIMYKMSLIVHQVF